MPLSTVDIQKLYIALFNRPADPAGEAFWAAQGDLAAVAQAMSGSPEYLALHGGQTSTAIVTTLYQNLFGRAPDADGLGFWVDALDRGVLNPASLAVEMSRVTQGTDGAVLTNKAAFAATFTTALDTPSEQAIYEANLGASSVRTLLNGVGADSASLLQAQNNVASTIVGLFPVVTPPVTPPVVTPPTPLTLTLTAAPDDAIIGGAGDDTVLGTQATFQTTDVIDGGAGFDTLRLTLSQTITSLSGANIRNIERLAVTASQLVVVQFGGVTGVTELVNDSSTGASVTFGMPADPANAVPELAALTITGGTSGTEVVFADAAVAGATDDMKVVLKNAGPLLRPLSLRTAGNATNQFESVSFDVSGVNMLALTTDSTQTSLQTVNITGGGSLGLQISNDWTRQQIRKIDARTATGDITLATKSAPLTSTTTDIRLGSGNDTIFMGANLGATSIVDGGAGRNTLVVTAAISNAMSVGLSNIDVIRLDATGVGITQNTAIAKLSTVDYEVLGAAGVVTLDRLASGKTVTVVGALDTLRPQLMTDTDNDSLTVKLDGGTTLNTLYAVTGLDTLHLASSGTNTIASDQVTARHVITGTGSLTIGGALQATDIDASGFSGRLSVRLGASPTTYVSGTGADTIVSGTGTSTIHLGSPGRNTPSGADVISLGGGATTLAFASGTGIDSAAKDYTAFAQVSYFHVGSDKLAFSADDNDFRVGDYTGLAKGVTAQGLTAGDAMVVQSVGRNSGALTAATDVGFLKLTGFPTVNGAIAAKFASVLGTTTVSGLAVNGNYVVSMDDILGHMVVIAVVNVGADGVLGSADFAAENMAIIGTIDPATALLDLYPSLGAGTMRPAF